VIINSNGDGQEQNNSLPWLLTEQWNIVKEVIRKIRFLTGFSPIPLFSRELIILETKRIAFGFIIFQFEKFYVKVS
jgi:hypothetical protein